jgi:hypothetical protein
MNFLIFLAFFLITLIIPDVYDFRCSAGGGFRCQDSIKAERLESDKLESWKA